MTLHPEALTPVHHQAIAINPHHAPFDALCAPHREVVAAANLAHGAKTTHLGEAAAATHRVRRPGVRRARIGVVWTSRLFRDSAGADDEVEVDA